MSRVCFDKVWVITDLLMPHKNSPEVWVTVIPHSPYLQCSVYPEIVIRR